MEQGPNTIVNKNNNITVTVTVTAIKITITITMATTVVEKAAKKEGTLATTSSGVETHNTPEPRSNYPPIRPTSPVTKFNDAMHGVN
jgi:hypothetical protein